MFISFIITSIVTSLIFAQTPKKAPKPLKESYEQNEINHLDKKAIDLLRKNWTNCEEFLNDTEFDVMRILEVDWKIFYFWGEEKDRSYNVRFHLPSRTLVHRFSDQLQDLKPAVNWTAAEMFMETSIDFSALFVRYNVSGLYRIVPSLSFDISSTPLLLIALKVVEPGYLGALNCANRMGYAMAPVESMPKPNEIEAAAMSFNVRNDFHWSYLEDLYEPPPLPTASPYEIDDRIDELIYDDDDIKKLQLI